MNKKVVCIDNSYNILEGENEWELISIKNMSMLISKNLTEHLIINKIYDVLDIDVIDFNYPKYIYYLIKNELGIKFWYCSERFIGVKDWRDSKISNILD